MSTLTPLLFRFFSGPVDNCKDPDPWLSSKYEVTEIVVLSVAKALPPFPSLL